jgi:hypothetical protein
LHLVAVAGSHLDDEVEFCSYCGRIDSNTERVCSHCGLGVRLRTEKNVLTPDAAFLIVPADGRVSAASEAAERVLGSDVVGRPLAALDLTGMDPLFAPCGDPPATLVVLRAA